MRGDDGIGIYAGRLLEKEGFHVLFCHSSPENFLSKIKDSRVLVVDAALIEKDYLVSADIKGVQPVSTHGMSLMLMQAYLKAKGISMALAGIKPDCLELNAPLSTKAKERAKQLVRALAAGGV